MENIRDIILGARAERQEHMLKGFAPVADETESDKVEKGDNVFEKMADAIEKSCSDDAEEAPQAEIEKSDIMNAISGYDSNIKFGKLGKEIKAKLKAEVLPPLNAKLQVLSAESRVNSRSVAAYLLKAFPRGGRPKSRWSCRSVSSAGKTVIATPVLNWPARLSARKKRTRLLPKCAVAARSTTKRYANTPMWLPTSRRVKFSRPIFPTTNAISCRLAS